MEICKVSFSPGDDCMNDIIEQIQSAAKFLDICVFTISDNRISDELIKAYNNGIEIRIISDNEKMNDDPALTLMVLLDRKHSLVGARRQLISTLDAQIQTSAFHIVMPLLCFVSVCVSVFTAARYYLPAVIL